MDVSRAKRGNLQQTAFHGIQAGWLASKDLDLDLPKGLKWKGHPSNPSALRFVFHSTSGSWLDTFPTHRFPPPPEKKLRRFSVAEVARAVDAREGLLVEEHLEPHLGCLAVHDLGRLLFFGP